MGAQRRPSEMPLSPQTPMTADPGSTRQDLASPVQSCTYEAGAGVDAGIRRKSPGKSPAEISEWLRSLPGSYVPHKTRDNLIKVVEENGYNGDAFSQYVKSIPPEVCAPQNAVKVR